MKTCKDCLHHEICKVFNHNIPNEYCPIEQQCDGFDDLSEWVHLPCKAGDLLYEITERRTRDKWQKVIKERVVNCIEVGIEGALGIRSGTIYLSLSRLHKTIFLTREEAEKALKERNKNDCL